jgi:hypothetical protein
VEGVRLDRAKIDARVAETAAVRDLLADIFADDDVGIPAVTAPAREPLPPVDDALLDLDAMHSGLVRAILTATAWPRAQLEETAAGLGIILLDPALDRINEAVLEECGEPLLEGDDPLELNPYAVSELFEHA